MSFIPRVSRTSIVVLCTALSSLLFCGELAPFSEWKISPYPDGRNFAFTIVHDADSAYSRRLAPLFEVFDEHGMRITATVFALWSHDDVAQEVLSKWKNSDDSESAFFKPGAVPLEDSHEKNFYQRLAVKGHEIGLHSPSEFSDRRGDFIRAFELYKSIFGEFPRTYVEHSRANNKEAQASEGAAPQSPYYSTDLLNLYQSWVWVDGVGAIPGPKKEKYYDILASYGSPFNNLAYEKYGILRGFRRTGQWKDSDGDGFLKWYSKTNIDSLESGRGTALVYTHLNYKWLDPVNRQMREEIRLRLAYVASKDGWFEPAGEILDRFHAIKNVHIIADSVSVRIVNSGSDPINGLTLLTHSGLSLTRNGVTYSTNEENEILVGNLAPYATIDFMIEKRAL